MSMGINILGLNQVGVLLEAGQFGFIIWRLESQVL